MIKSLTDVCVYVCVCVGVGVCVCVRSRACARTWVHACILGVEMERVGDYGEYTENQHLFCYVFKKFSSPVCDCFTRNVHHILSVRRGIHCSATVFYFV